MTEIFFGKTVKLRPATTADRRPIFDWLTNSDLTGHMMGPPNYPDSPIPTWEEFKNDYKEYFFDSSKPFLGCCYIIEVNSEAVGQINHDKISNIDNSTELDIWLRSKDYINKGYGSDAINTLCDYLVQKFGCKKFIISPSARNKVAVRAYEKAGFIKTEEKPEGFLGDYVDSVIMVKYI
jgi:RimJ/RimL family protein N-acetyltransferase